MLVPWRNTEEVASEIDGFFADVSLVSDEISRWRRRFSLSDGPEEVLGFGFRRGGLFGNEEVGILRALFSLGPRPRIGVRGRPRGNDVGRAFTLTLRVGFPGSSVIWMFVWRVHSECRAPGDKTHVIELSVVELHRCEFNIQC